MGYKSQVLTHSPVLFLHDINTTPTPSEWVNESGATNAVNATLQNSPTVLTTASDLPGDVPAAIRADRANNQGARAANYGALNNPNTAVTIGLWKRISNSQKITDANIGTGTAPTTMALGDNTYQRRFSGANRSSTQDYGRGTFRGGGNSDFDTFDDTGIFSEWTLEVYVWDAGTITMYAGTVSGSLQEKTSINANEGTVSSLADNTVADFTVAFQDNDGTDRRFIDGDFAGPFVIPSALTQAQVEAIYSAAFSSGEIAFTGQNAFTDVNGNAIQNATVYAAKPGVAEAAVTAQTDANGEVIFTGLDAQTTYYCWAEKDIDSDSTLETSQVQIRTST